jgi:hypothetical protein
MGTPRATTERQLSAAKAALEERARQLKTLGKAEGQFSRDPVYRQLASKVKQVGKRLTTIAALEAQNAELEKAAAEKREAKIAEKAQRLADALKPRSREPKEKKKAAAPVETKAAKKPAKEGGKPAAPKKK